jgi:hypothetical protein
MTDLTRRSFVAALGALFASFRQNGMTDVELVRATDEFLEDPEEETSTSSSVSSCSCPWRCPEGTCGNDRKRCRWFKEKANE